jgi:plastocyanin
MHRKLLIACAALLLVAAACSGKPSGPLKYSVEMDAKSTARDKFQFSAYYPGVLTVSAGDSVKFRNRSTEAPHTVTLGVDADRSNQPPPVTAKGQNPVAFAPCYTKDDPTPKLTSCKNQQLPTWDGTGFWNSGVLQPKPAPKSAGDKSVTLKLAKDIAPGDYAFTCLLHPLMNGTLTVIVDEGGRTKPSDVRKEGKVAIEAAEKTASNIDEPKLDGTEDGPTVAAGWGDKIIAVNRFSPAAVSVDAGSTVTWETVSPYEPHTVTFESPFSSPEDEGAIAPGGPESGSDYDGGFASSGIFGEGFPAGDTYALRFPKPGTYSYVCVLHPGQKGTVKVT